MSTPPGLVPGVLGATTQKGRRTLEASLGRAAGSGLSAIIGPPLAPIDWRTRDSERRMVAVSDITECRRTALGQLLAGEYAASRSRLSAGGRLAVSLPMLWPCDLEPIQSPHREVLALTADVELYGVRDATVGGPGAHVTTSGGYVWSAGAYPAYVKVWFENDITPEHWAVPVAPTRRIERAFVITHFNHVWGHWLTEVYPKLFQIQRLAAEGVVAPLLLPSTAPRFIREAIDATLPGQELITYDPSHEAILVELLLLPDMMNRNYIFHDDLRRALQAEVARRSRPDVEDPGHIFVSRRKMKRQSAYRFMENAPQLEAVAAELGLTIVHPERLTWPEQINLFANASVVVGEFGSGLHNAILSGSGTRVIGLNWIVDVQSRIANFRHHRVGYVLPDDSRPRGFSIGQELQPFSIDVDEFRHRVESVLQGARPCVHRGYEDITVQSAGLSL